MESVLRAGGGFFLLTEWGGLHVHSSLISYLEVQGPGLHPRPPCQHSKQDKQAVWRQEEKLGQQKWQEQPPRLMETSETAPSLSSCGAPLREGGLWDDALPIAAYSVEATFHLPG